MLNRSWGHSGRRTAVAVLMAVGLVGLAACETGPVYRPRGPDDVVGYTDQQLTQNRFRVTFTGGTGTRREQVENYLMRRAAEVTLQAGYTDFVFDTRDTKAQTYYRTDFVPRAGFGGGLGGGFGPRFGRFGPRPWYWSSFAFRDPWYDGDAIPVTRFSAYSEIIMLTADQAKDDPAAIDARDVLNRLAPPTPPQSPPPPRG